MLTYALRIVIVTIISVAMLSPQKSSADVLRFADMLDEDRTPEVEAGIQMWSERIEGLLDIIEQNADRHRLPDEVYTSTDLKFIRKYAYAVSDNELFPESREAFFEHYERIATIQNSQRDLSIIEMMRAYFFLNNQTSENIQSLRDLLSYHLKSEDPVVRMYAGRTALVLFSLSAIGEDLLSEMRLWTPAANSPDYEELLIGYNHGVSSHATVFNDLNAHYDAILATIFYSKSDNSPVYVLTETHNLIYNLTRSFNSDDFIRHSERLRTIDFGSRELHNAIGLYHYFVASNFLDLEGRYKALSPYVFNEFEHPILSTTAHLNFLWLLYLSNEIDEFKRVVNHPTMQAYRSESPDGATSLLIDHILSDAPAQPVVERLRFGFKGKHKTFTDTFTSNRNNLRTNQNRFVMYDDDQVRIKQQVFRSTALLKTDNLRLIGDVRSRIESLLQRINGLNSITQSSRLSYEDPYIFERTLNWEFTDYVGFQNDGTITEFEKAWKHLHANDPKGAWDTITPLLITNALQRELNPFDQLRADQILARLHFVENNLEPLIDAVDQLVDTAIDQREPLHTNALMGMIFTCLSSQHYYHDVLELLPQWTNLQDLSGAVTPYPHILKAEALTALGNSADAERALNIAEGSIRNAFHSRAYQTYKLQIMDEESPPSEIQLAMTEYTNAFADSGESILLAQTSPAYLKAKYLTGRLQEDENHIHLFNQLIDATNLRSQDKNRVAANAGSGRLMSANLIEAEISQSLNQSREAVQRSVFIATASLCVAALLLLSGLGLTYLGTRRRNDANDKLSEFKYSQVLINRSIRDGTETTGNFVNQIRRQFDILARQSPDMRIQSTIEHCLETINTYANEQNARAYTDRTILLSNPVIEDEINISQFMNEAEARWRRQIPTSEVSLEVGIDPDLSFIRSDRSLLATMLNECISLSIQHTSFGSIKVSATSLKTQHLEISITDSGDGRQNPDYDYEVTRHIAQLLEGTFNIDYPSKNGSRVTITLPTNVTTENLTDRLEPSVTLKSVNDR